MPKMLSCVLLTSWTPHREDSSRMKNYYRIMLGRKSRFAEECIGGGGSADFWHTRGPTDE
jgi:hypothetical protein